MLDRLRSHLVNGEYAAAKRLASAVLMTEDISPQEKAQAGILGARGALRIREGFAARALAERALGLAQECGDNDAEGRATFLVGAALLQIGDNAAARTFTKEFLIGLSDRWSHLEAELSAMAHGNLGQAYRNQKLYGEALQSFGKALTLFEAARDQHRSVACLHQIAWILMEIGDLEEAEAHLSRATTYGEMAPELESYHVEHLAWLSLRRGNHSEAVERAGELTNPNRSGILPGHKATAFYILGECARQVGRLTEAKALLAQAREHAVEAGLSRLINMVAAADRTIDKVSSDGAP